MKILVIGSLNTDIILDVDRFPNEGETLSGNSILTCIGGKGANQASAIALQGCDVTMLGMVGKNDYGNHIINELKNLGVNSCVSQIDTSTGTAVIERNSQGQNRIIIIPGANKELTPDKIDLSIIDQHNIIVMQFEIPLETVEYIAKEAKKRKKTVVLNPAPAYRISEELLHNIDYLIPNEHELEIISENHINSLDQIKQAVSKLPNTFQTIVTLGSKGVYVANQDILISSNPVKTVDTTGAGDAFIGGFVGALAKGFSIMDSVIHANKVAAISVTKYGAFATAGTFDETRQLSILKAKKVAIICSTGLTSSLLASKVKELFDDKYIVEVESSEILSQQHDYDLIFLSPQFNYEGDSSIIKILPANFYNISHIEELKFIIQELLEE